MTLSDDRQVLDRTVPRPPSAADSRWPGATTVRAALPVPRGVAELPALLRRARETADADQLDAAYAQCGAIVAAARRWRAAPALAAVLSLRCAIAWQLGWLRPSAADAVEAGELLATLGADPHGGPALLLLARHLTTLVDLGDHAAAEALLHQAGLMGDLPDSRDGILLRFARGRLHADAGRPATALPELFHCGERLAAWAADRPDVLPWRSTAAAALWHGGAHEAATRLAEAEVELARASGTTGALGRALRVHGMVLDGPHGLASLEEAIRLLEGSPRVFELALTLVEHGTRLNQLKRRPPARRVLRAGLELAERCGSPGLVQRARAQYTAAGGRPRPLLATGVSGLTAAERRAVALAATALTNRQIAEELFLSVRTVEIHLTNAYRKLGVSRRSELAAALTAADATT